MKPSPWEIIDSGVIRHAISPDRLGHAAITPDGGFEAGSYASFTLTYTAGVFGVDDSGSLRIAFRFASDQSNPQFDDPSGANYCTVEASNGATLEVRFDPKGNVRPWDRTIWIKVVKGYLKEGDTITIRFGVTDHGGPGMRLQTFCERTFEFRVLSDPIATFNFQPLPVQPTIAIVPGAPERFIAVLPTRRRPAEKFTLRIKGEDKWGNPSDRCDRLFHLKANVPVEGLPSTIRLRPGEFSAAIEGLLVAKQSDVVIELCDADGSRVTASNPLRITGAGTRHFWGDLHAQSEETIGAGSAREYFSFARDRSFLDACGHQGNDFQITDEFWAELNRLTAEFDAEGRFVALPGYEWSGNTALGGDRNVFFPNEGRRIRRSSHALIEDHATIADDCTTAKELFEAFARDGEFDVVCFAHCGGRYADISLAHDGRFERSVEVHSSWGTFEWLLHDAFRLGYRVGVVANSDGHKGRPGAEYPGAGKFGAIGGLTCYLMDTLDRDALLACLRRRHHYGTSGGPSGRMIIDLVAEFSAQGTLYHDDPKLGPADGRADRSAIMGDIVHLPSGEMTLKGSILCRSPIERVDIFNGLEHVKTLRPYRENDLGRRIRVIWEGAAYRGRFREVTWDGTATLNGNTFVRAEPINFFNRDKSLTQIDPGTLGWKSVTTGNYAGFDAWLAEPTAGTLSITTPLISREIPVGEIGFNDALWDAGGELPRFLQIFRLPDENAQKAMVFEEPIALRATGDNPVYVRVTAEDGTRAWTSPIYVYR